MKNTILLLIALSLSIANASSAEKGSTKTGKGWREAYGGDSTVSEFQSMARDVVSNIDDKDFKRISTKNKKLIQNIIETTAISCGSNLALNGVPKDAINYPFETPKRIVLDCKKWRDVFLAGNKYRLAIHEFLHLALVDDSNYLYSSKIIEAYFKSREVLESASSSLLQAAMECNVKSYQNFLSQGASIFYKYEYNVDALNSAISGACSDIVEDLIKLGANTNDDLILNRTLIYMVAGNVQVSSSQLNRKWLKIFKMLIEKNPRLINKSFGDLSIYAPFETKFIIERDNYSSNFRYETVNCAEGATVMHYLAVVENRELLSELEKIGYSMTTDNGCGQTPRSILQERK